MNDKLKNELKEHPQQEFTAPPPRIAKPKKTKKTINTPQNNTNVLPSLPKSIMGTSVAEKCTQAGFDPLARMIEMANDKNLDPWLQFAALKELAGYLIAKKKKAPEEPKSKEMAANKAQELSKLPDKDLLALTRERLKDITDP